MSGFDYDAIVIGLGPAGATFARLAAGDVRILALTRPGEAVEASFAEKEVTFTLISPKVTSSPLQPLVTAMTDDKEPEKREIDLKAFDGSDPFADTDLPVDL